MWGMTVVLRGEIIFLTRPQWEPTYTGRSQRICLCSREFLCRFLRPSHGRKQLSITFNSCTIWCNMHQTWKWPNSHTARLHLDLRKPAHFCFDFRIRDIVAFLSKSITYSFPIAIRPDTWLHMPTHPTKKANIYHIQCQPHQCLTSIERGIDHHHRNSNLASQASCGPKNWNDNWRKDWTHGSKVTLRRELKHPVWSTSCELQSRELEGIH